MSSEILPFVVGIPAFLALFPLFFMGICALIARGGWSTLARTYSSGPPAGNQKSKLVSGMVGSARYKNCLWATSTPEGLHLSALFFFKSGHKPLFLPWSEVTTREIIHPHWGKSSEIRVEQTDTVIVLRGVWQKP